MCWFNTTFITDYIVYLQIHESIDGTRFHKLPVFRENTPWYLSYYSFGNVPGKDTHIVAYVHSSLGKP